MPTGSLGPRRSPTSRVLQAGGGSRCPLRRPTSQARGPCRSGCRQSSGRARYGRSQRRSCGQLSRRPRSIAGGETASSSASQRGMVGEQEVGGDLLIGLWDPHLQPVPVLVGDVRGKEVLAKRPTRWRVLMDFVLPSLGIGHEDGQDVQLLRDTLRPLQGSKDPGLRRNCSRSLAGKRGGARCLG